MHITKKGDSPATLIIGGKDENHLFLIADCCSNIQITAAYVLGNLHAQQAFAGLQALAEDIYEASRVRISAIKALAKLDADATKVVLQNLLKSEKDEEIVALCMAILTT